MNLKKHNASNGNRLLKKQKNKLKAFQKIVVIFKINSIDSRFFVFGFYFCFLILCIGLLGLVIAGNLK